MHLFEYSAYFHLTCAATKQLKGIYVFIGPHRSSK